MCRKVLTAVLIVAAVLATLAALPGWLENAAFACPGGASFC